MFSFLRIKYNAEFLIAALSDSAKHCLWTRSDVKRTAFFGEVSRVKPLQLTTLRPETSHESLLGTVPDVSGECRGSTAVSVTNVVL